MFATLFFGLFDPKTRLLSYINGGHNPPVIIGTDGIKQRLNPTGPAIGLHFNVKIHINQITLLPGDTLFAYTDGITDARNPAGVSFTQQHLLSLLDQPTSSATELLDRIEKAVQVHTAEANQFDDITMLAVRLNGD
jgi:serine phosphatase RsbU (regulator of sigma subunit)